MNGWTDLLTETIRNLGSASAALLPRLAISALILLVGLLLAFIAQSVVRGIMQRSGLDRLLDRTWLGWVLRGFGQEHAGSRLAGYVTFWGILAVVMLTTADTLGLPAVSQMIGGLIANLPPLAVSVMVLLLGLGAATTARRAVEGVAERSRMVSVRPLGAATYYLIAALSAVIALSGLGIDFTIVTTVVGVMIGALATGLAVTIAIGSRDVARNTITGVYVRRDIRVGDRIRVDGIEGRVAHVGQTVFTLRQDGRTWLVPYDRLLASMFEILERAPEPPHEAASR